MPGPVGPDGMAFGPDGRHYLAYYGQGTIRIVDEIGAVVGSLSSAAPVR